jgi:hypothetical protein
MSNLQLVQKAIQALSPAEQALFAIGYYHQRNDFFRKTDPSEPNLTEPAQ